MPLVRLRRAPLVLPSALVLVCGLAFVSCGGGGTPRAATTTSVPPRATTTTTTSPPTTTTTVTTPYGLKGTLPVLSPLSVPGALTTFDQPAAPGEGVWQPAGRLVRGAPAVYETTLVPPGGTQPAGIAWLDMHRLFALLYSGSRSPGGGPYRFAAPIEPLDAASLVAAFNGGFIMNVARGGYYTEGHVVVPLVTGAASFVIYADGSVNVGAWGTDVSMNGPTVVAVRQNLEPLVESAQPTAQAMSADWGLWGNTCGATSCASTVPGIENQWRSGAGVTSDGALVYVNGPGLDPSQLAQLLVRAGAVRGMELDINPSWPVLATYNPAPGGLASPSNGSKLLAGTIQGPWTFFEPGWNRDFITMSARPGFVP